MNKAYRKFRIGKLFFWVFVCLYFFNLNGCGLDLFYVLQAPSYVENLPSYTNADKINNVFIFYTNETGFPETFKFNGTDIYYKIYNSSSTLQADVDYIVTRLDSSTSSTQISDYLADKVSSSSKDLSSTHGSFSKLRIKNKSLNVLIPYNKNDKTIKLRLTDFQDEVSNSARLLVDGINYGQPVRESDNLTFNFGRTSKDPYYNKVPVAEDEDVKYTSGAGDTVWYVALFAMACGKTVDNPSIKSLPLYLGSVKIDSSSEDN